MRAVTFVKCLLGKHHRSRSRVYHDGSIIRSYCRACGAAMVHEKGLWRAVRKGERLPHGT